MNKNLHKHIRNQYDKNKYLNSGMPLTDKDLEMLEVVKKREWKQFKADRIIIEFIIQI